jgi:hypothetical protein
MNATTPKTCQWSTSASKAVTSTDPAEQNLQFQLNEAYRMLRDSATELRELWDILNGILPRCRDCADHCGNCPLDDKPCNPHIRAVQEAKRLKALDVVSSYDSVGGA